MEFEVHSIDGPSSNFGLCSFSQNAANLSYNQLENAAAEQGKLLIFLIFLPGSHSPEWARNVDRFLTTPKQHGLCCVPRGE